MRRWSLWWWAPPVVLGLAAGMISAEPTYSPHSFSDHLVLARQILLISAALYLWILVLFRMLYAVLTGPRRVRPPHGFDVLPPGAKSPSGLPACR